MGKEPEEIAGFYMDTDHNDLLEMNLQKVNKIIEQMMNDESNLSSQQQKYAMKKIYDLKDGLNEGTIKSTMNLVDDFYTELLNELSKVQDPLDNEKTKKEIDKEKLIAKFKGATNYHNTINKIKNLAETTKM